MIRKTLILLWMLFPVAVAAYHFNYGPKQVMRERAYRLLCEIRQLERAEGARLAGDHRSIQRADGRTAARRRSAGALPDPAGRVQGAAGDARPGQGHRGADAALAGDGRGLRRERPHHPRRPRAVGQGLLLRHLDAEDQQRARGPVAALRRAGAATVPLSRRIGESTGVRPLRGPRPGGVPEGVGARTGRRHERGHDDDPAKHARGGDLGWRFAWGPRPV